jgi:hypothetical protein
MSAQQALQLIAILPNPSALPTPTILYTAPVIASIGVPCLIGCVWDGDSYGGNLRVYVSHLSDVLKLADDGSLHLLIAHEIERGGIPAPAEMAIAVAAD